MTILRNLKPFQYSNNLIFSSSCKYNALAETDIPRTGCSRCKIWRVRPSQLRIDNTFLEAQKTNLLLLAKRRGVLHNFQVLMICPSSVKNVNFWLTPSIYRRVLEPSGPRAMSGDELWLFAMVENSISLVQQDSFGVEMKVIVVRRETCSVSICDAFDPQHQ